MKGKFFFYVKPFSFLFVLSVFYSIIGSLYHFSVIDTSDISGNHGNLITIDALITTSTISFVAFTNYAPSASGSSQVIRKASWGNVYKFDGKKFKSPVLFIQTYSYILITVLITFSDVFILGFGNNNFINLLLMLNVAFSSVIIIILFTKYIYFNSNSYVLTSNYVILKIYDVTIRNYNFDEIRNIKRTYLNPLKNSTNQSLIRELLRKFVSIRKFNKTNKKALNIFEKSFESEIIMSPNRSSTETLSLFVTFKQSNKIISKSDMDYYKDIVFAKYVGADDIRDPDYPTLNIISRKYIFAATKIRLIHNSYIKSKK